MTITPSATMPSPQLLITRSPERAAGLLDLLRPLDVKPTVAPVIERASVTDAAGLARLAEARRKLADGDYAWVAVTSVNAVDTLLGTPDSGENDPAASSTRPPHARADTGDTDATDPRTRPGPADTTSRSHDSSGGLTRWACVGPATRRAVEAHGITVEVVPPSRMTGAGLVAVFPEPGPGSRKILLPLGDLAAPTVPEGLRAAGWDPEVVTAYRTVARDLPRHVVEQARTTGYDAVVVASGSAARQVAAQIGPQRVVAIGEPSAVVSREVGHEVLAVADRPTDPALAAAVRDALGLGSPPTTAPRTGASNSGAVTPHRPIMEEHA